MSTPGRGVLLRVPKFTNNDLGGAAIGGEEDLDDFCGQRTGRDRSGGKGAGKEQQYTEKNDDKACTADLGNNLHRNREMGHRAGVYTIKSWIEYSSNAQLQKGATQLGKGIGARKKVTS